MTLHHHACDMKAFSKYGDAGRLRIRSLFIDKRLFRANGDDAQKIVDDKYSAAYMDWWGFPLIADHATDEGTWRLQYAIPNWTKATIEQNGKTTTYVCSQKQLGFVKDGKLHDNQKRLVREQPIEMCIYTCTGRTRCGGKEVWLTYWRKLKNV